MTETIQTEQTVPSYHIDHTIYHGRPADTANRLKKEIRVYDFLDSLDAAYIRVDHDALLPLKRAGKWTGF